VNPEARKPVTAAAAAADARPTENLLFARWRKYYEDKKAAAPVQPKNEYFNVTDR
jgi:hypothetical protein